MTAAQDREAAGESAAGHWSRLPERGSILGLRFTVACYRGFGRWLGLPLVHAVVSYFYLTDRVGRAASRQFLSRLHAHLLATGRAPGFRPGRWESYQHYRAFALSIVDRVAMWSGMQDRFRFDFARQEELEKAGAGGRGVILLGAHLGSFDALRSLAVRDSIPVNAVMFTAHASRINRVLRELSPDVDVRVLPVSHDPVETVLRIHACLRRGEWVAILADRIEPTDAGRSISVPFLGEPALLPEAPFLLAATARCPVFTIFALRRSSNRYEVVCDPLLDGRDRLPRGSRGVRATELAREYAERLEAGCVSAHRQWFNFFDFWSAEPRA